MADTGHPLLLIIDDDPEIVRVLQVGFEQEAYHVATATNGKAGLEEARKHPPHLIILDVSMPGMDGLEVCRVIKQDASLRHIPIIMLTAKHLDEGLEPALTAKANWYMEKPFDFPQLLFQVKNLLGQRPPTGPTHPKGEQFL